MINLEQKHLQIILQLLEKYVPTMIVWAYGSRVNGLGHEGSDLDLVVINPNNKTLVQTNLHALREAFSESNLPFSVDVLDWAQIPDSFQQEIQKKYVVLYPS